jgi:hypothetical protein
MLGSRISATAFPVLVLHLNNSPFIAGLVTCAAIMPGMLAYVPAGILVDRWDPWRVMLATEFMRGAAVAAMVTSILIFNGSVSIYLLLSIMVAEEILGIFWMLADRRLMSKLMDPDKIVDGQSSVEVRSHVAVLAGRPLGPFLFSLKQYLPFLADAASFAVSVAVLILLGRRRAPMAPAQERQTWRESGEGFTWLKRDRRTGIAMALMSLATLIAQALIMVFLAEAHDNQLSTAAIGAVLAASGVGGAIGAAVARKLPGWIRGHSLRIQLWAWSLALALLAVTGVRSSWCITIVMLILGLTGSISNIEFGSYLIVKAGDKLARVTSIGQVMVIGACAIGPFLGGSAIQWLGARGADTLFLCLVVMAAAIASRLPRISFAETGDGTEGFASASAGSCPVAEQGGAQPQSGPSVQDTSAYSAELS